MKKSAGEASEQQFQSTLLTLLEADYLVTAWVWGVTMLSPFSLCLQIGPRLELEVMKVEEGLCDGKVLYHSIVKKSAGEASEQQDEKEKARQLKEKRRKQQVQVFSLMSTG